MGMLLRRHKPKKEQEPAKVPVSEKAEPKKRNTKAKEKEKE